MNRIKMCELHLVYKLNGNLNNYEKDILFKMMKISSVSNDDGHGIWSKSIFYKNAGKFAKDKKLRDKILKSEGHLVLGHTRFATHGKVCQDNTHPFDLTHIVFLHNGIISKYDDKELPTSNSDSLFIAKKINEEFAKVRNEKKAIKNVLEKIEGTLSILIYFKDTGNLYYFKNANGFHFALTDGNCIIANSDRDNILNSTGYSFFGFRLPSFKILSEIDTETDKLYMINREGIKVIENHISTKEKSEHSNYPYHYDYNEKTKSWDMTEDEKKEEKIKNGEENIVENMDNLSG